jgi:hypothetical protein
VRPLRIASNRGTSLLAMSAATGEKSPRKTSRKTSCHSRQGFRLLSAYRTRAGEKLWVITEADRSSTCILLPEEY